MADHDEEKNTPLHDINAEDSGSSTPQHLNTHHHHHHHTGDSNRLHHFLHPSGKIFHVVRTHHEIDQKRRAILSSNPTAKSSTPTTDQDFEIVVHGTDEHINAVRDTHLHQTKSRDELYSENSALLSRYENVRLELDALSRELHDLTDHAVSLEASFDKWGYSAQLRTHGESNNSETSSLNTTASHDASKHDDRTLTAMKFFKTPVVRQYFHKGLIWRSPNASEVVSFELFVDLVYVAVIDAIGEVAVVNASGASFLHYIIVFYIASKVFNDILLVMNWFEINDIFSRLCVLFILVCLYSFASNTEYFFEYTYTAGVAFYLASRFFVALWFFFAAVLIPMVRWNMCYHGVVAIVAAAFWIGSIHIEYPLNLPLIFIAIAIDMFASLIFMPAVMMNNKKNRFFRTMTEYLPAVNIEHRVERTGAFISLVIGYSVIKIFFQSRSTYPMNAFLGKGILGLIQAFIFNWIYFEIDAWGVHMHAIRRHWISTGVWNLMHLPFSAAFILAASTLSELVVAHDCSDADPETLAEGYAATSISELEPALRWFYCGGLGVALISMAIISLCHIHKRLPNPKLSKRLRLAYRVAVAIIIICLPLANDHLTSLDLIATTTCLVASVLFVDIFGLSCSGDGFFTGGFCAERKRRTQYTARCKLSARRKKEMQRAVQKGEKMELDDVLRRDGSVSSFESADTRVGDVDRGAGAY